MGDEKMRQANSTIKGYSYQFNKSILEILLAEETDEIVLEGVIEDIDVQSPTSTNTIQCKYHEDTQFQMSNVAGPITEMLCHYCECLYLGKPVMYILYAYFAQNVDSIEMSDYVKYLETTTNKDFFLKYFHRIYSIPDAEILAIANKPRKSNGERNRLIDYYKTKRTSLSLRVNIQDFWNVFSYVKAVQFETLQVEVIQALETVADTDYDTARSLYYPNAFSRVALLSSKPDSSERTITKNGLINFLKSQKSVLLNRWTIEALDRVQILKSKKEFLASAFATNPDVRAFVLSDSFLNLVGSDVIAFLHEYINKYYKKPRLQMPPIFIFGDKSSALMQQSLLELYKYQQQVNTGSVGDVFIEDSFINNTACPSGFVCKMTLLGNITIDVLEKCKVNQLYIIGNVDKLLSSPNYYTESLEVTDIGSLRYLVGLARTPEV